MYKLVIFDLDGTIADTDMMIVEIYRHLLAKYRPDFKPTYELLLSFSGPTIKTIFDKYFPELDIKKLTEDFMFYKEKFVYDMVKPYPDIHRLLFQLKELGIKVALVTNGYSASAKITLKAAKLENEFDFIVGLDAVSAPKPSPEGVLLAVKEMQVSKKDTLFVGDAVTDYLAAKSADIDCCLVGWNLRGFAKETNPKFLVNNVNELMEVILNGNKNSI